MDGPTVKLVLTLLGRDEADVVDANVAFHLNAGVDFVIATDNRSEDGTTEILERYAREGYVHLIREQGQDMRLGEWVTRMARLAAREFGADWVINADADEFYWPRGGSLKEVLAAVPDRFGCVRAFVRTFVLRPGTEGELFAERMTVRLTPRAPFGHPATPFRPGAKIVHRAAPDITVADGTHALPGSSFELLRGWHPIEMLHFPVRTAEQGRRKYVTATAGWERDASRPTPHYLLAAYGAYREGRLDEHLRTLTVDDELLARGEADGSMVRDYRLRDALRALRVPGEGGVRFRLPSGSVHLSFGQPSLEEEVEYAVDAAVLAEADVVRLRRRLDELETREALAEPG
jgi:Glycosyl transferase family 2